jgi:hypothetical protein
MLFMVISLTRAGLTGDQLGKLAKLGQDFYAHMPADVRVRAEWVASDGRQFALLEAPDLRRATELHAPFGGLVDSEIVAVQERTGWTAS